MSDTDVFVSLIHLFYACQLLGLKELLMVCGSGTSKLATKLTTLKTACGDKGNLLKQFLSKPFPNFSLTMSNVSL